jgi:hypothetical protein
VPDSADNRGALPHPPKGIPKYFDRSPYDAAEVVPAGAARSHALTQYEAFAKGHFGVLPAEITRSELERLERFLRARLELEREERRMHFGAFALCCLLLFLLLPRLVETGFGEIWLGALAVLLVVLIAPYIFVYFGYENRVRAMSLGLLRVIDAIASRDEARTRVPD